MALPCPSLAGVYTPCPQDQGAQGQRSTVTPPFESRISTHAWSGNAELLARLPADAQRLVVPCNSRIEPLGVWSGLAWRPSRRLANAGGGSSSSRAGPTIWSSPPGGLGDPDSFRGFGLNSEAHLNAEETTR